MTHENVSKVLTSIPTDRLGEAVRVPWRMREKISHQKSTDTEHRRETINYFLKYSEIATWHDLASRLYWLDHQEAVKATKVFIKRALGKPCSTQRLSTTLAVIRIIMQPLCRAYTQSFQPPLLIGEDSLESCGKSPSPTSIQA